ncbi:hypothetical protein [Lentzea sp. NPDC059081]|uniref:hypothetical protein n=1 Tax=Lentzea sp. NPDC059081 TaxID=3346719 RepID=UPI0036CAB2C7
MTQPNTSGPSQQNTAHNGGTVYANQGGKMRVDNRTYIKAKVHAWTGWAVLVMLAADTVFFFYGASAYTGTQGDSGDLVRAGVYLVMMAVTISLVRRWFRTRL